MLPTNFELLAQQEPELRPVILKVGDWIRRHPDWKILDPRILSRDLRDVDPIELTLTLRELVITGFFEQVYRVASPTGDLTEEEFSEIRSIPRRLRNNFNEPFDIDDGEVVPVLKPRSR